MEHLERMFARSELLGAEDIVFAGGNSDGDRCAAVLATAAHPVIAGEVTLPQWSGVLHTNILYGYH